MNKALVAKMTWEVASNADKMWVRVFNKKYVRSKIFMRMSVAKVASWSCQSIFGGRKVIKKGLCHRIGNGLNTWIWEDPWIPNEPSLIPQARSGVTREAYLVADLIDQDSRQWDRGLLSDLFEPATINRILSIHLSQQSVNDQVFWCLNPSSEFSVKSAHNAFRTPSSISHPVLQGMDWKVLWKMKIHARLKNLLWKLAWEILPTASILNSKVFKPGPFIEP